MTGMARPLAAQPCAPPPGTCAWHLEAEGQAFHPGQVVYLPLTIRGKNGVVESNADEAVTLTVKGGERWALAPPTLHHPTGSIAGRCTTLPGLRAGPWCGWAKARSP